MVTHVAVIPHPSIMIAIQIDGRRTFSIRFEGTSNSAYGMKNIVRHRLYCVGVRLRSVFNPMIAALPTVSSLLARGTK